MTSTLPSKTCRTWAASIVPLQLFTRTALAQEESYEPCYTTVTNGQCGSFCKDATVGTPEATRTHSVTAFPGGDDPGVWGDNPFHWHTYGDEAAMFMGIVSLEEGSKEGFMTVECVTPPAVYTSDTRNGVTSKPLDPSRTGWVQGKVPGAFKLAPFYLPTPAPPETPAPAVPTPEPEEKTEAPLPRPTPRPGQETINVDNNTGRGQGGDSGDEDDDKSWFERNVEDHATKWLIGILVALVLCCLCFLLLAYCLRRRSESGNQSAGKQLSDESGSDNSLLSDGSASGFSGSSMDDDEDLDLSSEDDIDNY